MSNPAAPYAVYRAFNRDDHLLYVGSSSNPGGRFHTHSMKASWWSEVERIDLEWLPGRSAALAAERLAIEDEHPIYNEVYTKLHVVAGGPPHADREPHRALALEENRARAENRVRAQANARLEELRDVHRRLKAREATDFSDCYRAWGSAADLVRQRIEELEKL